MYNVLLISTSRSRTKYFNQIKTQTNLNVTVHSNPLSLNLSSYFKIKKNIHFTFILEEKFREIDLKYSNPFYKFIYKNYIKFLTPLIATSYYGLINKYHSDIIGVWNGKKFPEIIATEVAKFSNIQCIYFENGLFPNTTVVDAKGVNATNSLPRKVSFYQAYPSVATLPQQLNVRKTLGKRIETTIQLPTTYLFVPFQTNFDTQIVYHGRWINNMEHLFGIIYQVAESLKIHFILKEHPSERQMDYTHLHKKAKNNPYINFANEINTQELIQKSSAIVTVNSSVGLESLLFNKKVIVLGEAFYNINGITKSATTIEELKEIINHLERWEIHTEDTKKFLSYILQEYLIEGSWKNPDEHHFHQLESRIKAFLSE